MRSRDSHYGREIAISVQPEAEPRPATATEYSNRAAARRIARSILNTAANNTIHSDQHCRRPCRMWGGGSRGSRHADNLSSLSLLAPLLAGTHSGSGITRPHRRRSALFFFTLQCLLSPLRHASSPLSITTSTSPTLILSSAAACVADTACLPLIDTIRSPS